MVNEIQGGGGWGKRGEQLDGEEEWHRGGWLRGKEKLLFARFRWLVTRGGAGGGKGSGESAVQNLLAGRVSDPKKEPHSRSEKELPLILLLQAGATVLTNVLI